MACETRCLPYADCTFVSLTSQLQRQPVARRYISDNFPGALFEVLFERRLADESNGTRTSESDVRERSDGKPRGRRSSLMCRGAGNNARYIPSRTRVGVQGELKTQAHGTVALRIKKGNVSSRQVHAHYPAKDAAHSAVRQSDRVRR